jgi:hypothetical protein
MEHYGDIGFPFAESDRRKAPCGGAQFPSGIPLAKTPDEQEPVQQCSYNAAFAQLGAPHREEEVAREDALGREGVIGHRNGVQWALREESGIEA